MPININGNLNRQRGQAAIVIIIIVIIVLVVGYYLIKTPVPTPVPPGGTTTIPTTTPIVPPLSATGTAALAATVTYTDAGFAPSPVTIRRGGTVTFVNNSSLDFWPASANHPTHTVYPERTAGDCFGSAFDACERVPPGQSWSFTFNEIGEWSYHNHLASSHTGRVIVQ